jgi:hypothetical protein
MSAEAFKLSVAISTELLGRTGTFTSALTLVIVLFNCLV